MGKQKIYAAYDGDMDRAQMKIQHPEARCVGMGLLLDYKLTFRYNGFAHIEPSQGGLVPVLLWQIDDDCESRIDIYKKFPKARKKVDAQVLPIMLDPFRYSPWCSDINPDVADKIVKSEGPDLKNIKIAVMTYVMADEYAEIKTPPDSEVYMDMLKSYVNNEFDLDILMDAQKDALAALDRGGKRQFYLENESKQAEK